MTEQGLVKVNGAMVPVNDAALPDDMDVFKLGSALAASGYFKDVRNEAQAVAKILAGRELGFGPVASLMGIYIVDGKPTMASNLIAAAIKKSGRYNYRIIASDDRRCELQFVERWEGKWQDVGVPSTFSVEDAQRAKLTNKDVWQKYPRNMLFSRALTNGARWYCPDVFVTGIYTPDEISDEFVLSDDGTTYRRVGRPSNDQTPGNAVADALEASDANVAKAREQASQRTAKRAEKAAPAAEVMTTITKGEAKDLFTLATECGWTKDELQFWLHRDYGVGSLAAITRDDYTPICKRVATPELLDDVRAEMQPAAERSPSMFATDENGKVIE